VASPVYLRHACSLEHDTGGGHPERAERIRAVEARLDGLGWLGYEVQQAPAATDEELLAVHPPEHLATVEALSASGGGGVDPDTIASAATAEAARRAAGGAVAMVDGLVSGSLSTAFCGLRPPGHHAERARAMGFCFFNSVAVAAQRAIDHHGVGRVLIVDWDVHHGNGTEAIFAASPEVVYVSLHQWPLYPGTGSASDTGRGAGAGYTLNLPVPPGSGDDVFCSLVEHVVVPAARAFAPGLILLSAGFDAHQDDPLADCLVSDEGFRAMARALRRVAGELGVPLGAVLEGGYELGALSRGVASTMAELAAQPDGRSPGLGPHPLAQGYAAELASRPWGKV